jgi:hypothetical protein
VDNVDKLFDGIRWVTTRIYRASCTLINGVFDNGDGLVDLGGRVGVTANDPQFVCRTSDVSNAAEGDALVTGSVNYTIRDVIDDGTGMTTLMLETD